MTYKTMIASTSSTTPHLFPNTPTGSRPAKFLTPRPSRIHPPCAMSRSGPQQGRFSTSTQRPSSTPSSTSRSRSRSMLASALPLLVALDVLGRGVVGVNAAGNAAGSSLYTDSVTYCADAEAILVSDFDISYFKANHSILFYISAASVDANLYLSANVYANAYGKELLNLTIDLCSLLDGVLCPLPEINFTGYGTYPLPTQYESKIPNLAWTVPDLEAFARITLTDTATSTTAACLQATLSNGWSTKQKGVEVGSAVFFIVALVVGLVFTTIWASPSPSIYRWYDILYLFQTAAASGLLKLNYPSAYTNFTLNFSWALGLFTNARVEAVVNKMRSQTGGQLTDTAYTAVDYINRKLSPYNEALAIDVNSLISTVSTASDYRSLVSRAASAFDPSGVQHLRKRVEIPTVSDQNETDSLANGYPVYLNSLGIPTANGFDTIFFIYLMAMAVVIGLHAIWFAIIFALDLLRSSEKRGTGWVGRQRKGFFWFFGGNMLRLLLIFYFPVTLFAFYQFVIGRSDSWLSILLAALTLAWTIIPFLTILGLSIRRSRRNYAEHAGVSPLYTKFRWFSSAGMIYRQYRQKYHFWWVVPLAVATFAKAAFIGFGANSPWTQVIGLVVIEFLVLVSYIVFRPHKDKKGDILNITLSIFRMIAFGLLIAFIPALGVTAIIRTVIGIVLVAVYGIPVVILLIGLFFNIGFGLLYRRNRERVEDGTEVIMPGTAVDETSSQEPAMRQVDLLGEPASATGAELPAHTGTPHEDGANASDVSSPIPNAPGYGHMPVRHYEPEPGGWADPNQHIEGEEGYAEHARDQDLEEDYPNQGRRSYGVAV